MRQSLHLIALRSWLLMAALCILMPASGTVYTLVECTPRTPSFNPGLKSSFRQTNLPALTPQSFNGLTVAQTLFGSAIVNKMMLRTEMNGSLSSSDYSDNSLVINGGKTGSSNLIGGGKTGSNNLIGGSKTPGNIVTMHNFMGKYDVNFLLVGNKLQLILDKNGRQMVGPNKNVALMPAIGCYYITERNYNILSRTDRKPTVYKTKSLWGLNPGTDTDAAPLLMTYRPVNRTYEGTIYRGLNADDPSEISIRFMDNELCLVAYDTVAKTEPEILSGIIMTCFKPNDSHRYQNVATGTWQSSGTVELSPRHTNGVPGRLTIARPHTYSVKNFCQEGVAVAYPFQDIDPAQIYVEGDYKGTLAGEDFVHQLFDKTLGCQASRKDCSYDNYDYFSIEEDASKNQIWSPEKEFIYYLGVKMSHNPNNWRIPSLGGGSLDDIGNEINPFGTYTLDVVHKGDATTEGGEWQDAMTFKAADGKKYKISGIARCTWLRRQLVADLSNPYQQKLGMWDAKHECNLKYDNVPTNPDYMGWWSDDPATQGELKHVVTNTSALNWRIYLGETLKGSYRTPIVKKEFEQVYFDTYVHYDYKMHTRKSSLHENYFEMTVKISHTRNVASHNMLLKNPKSNLLSAYHLYMIPGIVDNVSWANCVLRSFPNQRTSWYDGARTQPWHINLVPDTGLDMAVDLTNTMPGSAGYSGCYYVTQLIPDPNDDLAITFKVEVLDDQFNNYVAKLKPWNLAQHSFFTFFIGEDYAPGIYPNRSYSNLFSRDTFMKKVQQHHSGIENDTEYLEITEVARYDTMGREVGDDYRGMVVVRYSDGSVRKMVAK